MASLNRPSNHKVFTAEGAPAIANLTPEQQLRRCVMSCLLWENQFYLDGVAIADKIVETARQVDPVILACIAEEVRTQQHLRHVPLLLLDVLSEMPKLGKMKGQNNHMLIADTIAKVVMRPDELSEFLAVYWRNGRKTVSHQIRKGLAQAFGKFSEYSLAKYDRDGAIKLRDVLRICHPKPKDEAQAALFKKVLDRTLTTPDTWEVALSGGADKKATFERLLREGNLGYFALIRNLRNMVQAGVDEKLVTQAITARKNGADKILPFRFVAAARHAPRYEAALDEALLANLRETPPLGGRTGILVDISWSMNAQLSGKSEMKRMDAAAALAALFPADRKDIRTYSFSNQIKEVPTRLGMSGVDTIINSQPHQNTYLGRAVEFINQQGFDRIVVITDEQSQDRVPNPVAPKAYMINVASYTNGVGYRNGWQHIDGWSDNVFGWMRELESA